RGLDRLHRSCGPVRGRREVPPRPAHRRCRQVLEPERAVLSGASVRRAPVLGLTAAGPKLPGPMATDPSELGRRLREGDRSAAAAALNVIENRADRDATRELLAELSPAALGGEPRAHLIGITGPPGAGKSSLLSALVSEWRGRGRTVAVLAVDPSSKRSGGSLLGDRARIDHDPRDDGVLIRSTAAGGRLGGLAAPTREAA